LAQVLHGEYAIAVFTGGIYMEQDVNFRSSRTPNCDIAVGRITVFLGANGTGKSKLLQEVLSASSTLFPGYTAVRIEGGRAITLKDSLALDRNTFSPYRTLETAKATHKGKIGSTLSSRVFDAMQLLERMGRNIKSEHSDAVIEWQIENLQGPCPQRDQHPLERVFDLFNEIFPRIKLTYNESSQAMSCKKGESAYPPSQLSDGEKQCFSILADLVELADDRSVVFVDEPELNLNPLLANKLWDTVEAEFPDATFVYATHSVSFAMRPNVRRVHVLSDNNSSIQEINVISDVTMDELPPLLGSIPAILTTSTAIVTEGTEKSFDGIFYNWLVPDIDFETVPVGGGNDVAAVAARIGVWEAIAANFKLIGVVDRDFKSDQQLTELSQVCAVLELHEAESYLCDPTILVAIAKALGTAEPLPNEETIKTVIVAYFAENAIRICAKRLFSRLSYRIGVSARKRVCSTLTDYNSLSALLKKEVQAELDKTMSIFDDDAVSKIFNEERRRCEDAHHGDDISILLTLAPGKEVLNRLAPTVGCKNSLAVARAAKRHINPAAYPKLVLVAENIRRHLE
jgi:ABC-type lipoprotein export system ATPase subunit